MRDWLDTEEFDNAMYAYRTARVDAASEFEHVKEFIRKQIREKREPPVDVLTRLIVTILCWEFHTDMQREDLKIYSATRPWEDAVDLIVEFRGKQCKISGIRPPFIAMDLEPLFNVLGPFVDSVKAAR